MLTLILKLLIAHLIGDFAFQPTSWVKDKESKKHKSPFLYIHILAHFLLLLLFLSFDMKYLGGMLIIVFSHLFIDMAKLHMTAQLNGKVYQNWLFVADQLLHLIIIALVVYMYEPYVFKLQMLSNPKVLLFIGSVTTVTFVVSVIMKLAMAKWFDELEDKNASLQHAGKYIGMLERLLVFIFIAVNHWEAIGFLIAAKSVFRFGDLSKSSDRKLTEYMLIGTLISMGMAILIGLSYVYLNKAIASG